MGPCTFWLGHAADALSFLLTDPYSYTALGLPWINHEWLFELSMAGFYAAFGVVGLVLLTSLVRLLLGVLMVYSLVRASMAPLQISLVFILLAPALQLGINTVRPQLATYLMSAVLWTIIVAAEDGHLRRLGSAAGVCLVETYMVAFYTVS